MSNQTFEILCPVCRSVVPMDAAGCPTCARSRRVEQGTEAPAAGEAAPAPQPVAQVAPDLRSLTMKDYHRVVRATYSVTEGTATGSRMRAYLPFVLLVVLLIVGAAVIFGHMP